MEANGLTCELTSSSDDDEHEVWIPIKRNSNPIGNSLDICLISLFLFIGIF